MTNKFAIVCVVFGDPQYLLCAINLGFTASLTDTIADLVCMITPDINEFINDKNNLNIKNKLYKYFDHIILTDYIIKKSINSDKINETYPWINKSFTKWNCLSLIQYKKVLFLDSDQLVIRNVDDIWNLNTPAASFGDFTRPYSFIRNENLSSQHGKIIYNNQLIKFMDKHFKMPKFLIMGSVLLLAPSTKAYNLMLDILNKNDVYKQLDDFSNGVDECLIFDLYTNYLKYNWVHISPSYSAIIWHITSPKTIIEPNDKIKIIHYFGTKPWSPEFEQWEDSKIWNYFKDIALGLLTEKEAKQKYLTRNCDMCDSNTKYCIMCKSNTHNYIEIINSKLIVSNCY